MKKLIIILLCSGLALYIARREYPDLFKNSLSFLSESSTNRQQIGDIQKHRQRIAQLEAQLSQTTAIASKLYTDVSALQILSNTANPAEIAKLRSKMSAFETVNMRVKELSRELDAEKQQLNAILVTANSATVQATNALATPKPTPGPRKRVIMYTTTGCPACVAAKAYFAKKGLFYSEINVDTSTSAEFKRIGGKGVPLILIGEQRIQGFNAAAIDAALQ